MDAKNKVPLSKLMAKILRHKAMDYGISMDSEGYVFIDDLLQLACFKQFRTTKEDIHEAVANSDKQRFALTSDGLKVRANQGHSIDGVIDEHALLEELTAARVAELTSGTGLVYHGTYLKALGFIEEEGLCRMARTHIHFATAYDGSSISGMRRNCEVVVAVDVVKAMEEGGLVFFRSDNGVILCTGEGERGIISPEFFRTIIHLK